MDGAFKALQDYEWRVGTVYPSPAHIIDAPKDAWEYGYHTALWPMRTTTFASYGAPTYGWKANPLYPVKGLKPTNIGPGTGAAPTAGVYTGIPSGCTSKGNPYS